MTSKTFNLNIFRLNGVGHPKTFNLNILKAYKVKLMCGEKPKTFNLIVLKTMQVNWNVYETLTIFHQRLPSTSTSMSLVARNRIVVIIGALQGVVIARLIATSLPSCLGAFTTVIRIHALCLPSRLAGVLPINPSV